MGRSGGAAGWCPAGLLMPSGPRPGTCSEVCLWGKDRGGLVAGLGEPWWGPWRPQARCISLPGGHRLPRAPSSQHCPQSPSIFPCGALLARRPCGRQVWGSQPCGEAPVGEDLLRGHPGPGAQARVGLPAGVGSRAANQQPLPQPTVPSPRVHSSPPPRGAQLRRAHPRLRAPSWLRPV